MSGTSFLATDPDCGTSQEPCPVPKEYLHPVKPLTYLQLKLKSQQTPTPNFRKWVGVGQHHNDSQHALMGMTQWLDAGVVWGSFQALKTLWILGTDYWGEPGNHDVCHLCVICVCLVLCQWSLLCRGLGHGVTGAVANTREGFLARQRPHSIHPVSYGVPRCRLWGALFQQLIGWPGR